MRSKGFVFLGGTARVPYLLMITIAIYSPPSGGVRGGVLSFYLTSDALSSNNAP